MHILMISDVYFPRINGVSTSIQTFRRALGKLGHKVTLIAPDYGCEQGDEADLIRISARGVFRDPEDRMMRIRPICELLPALRQGGFDLLHIQTPFIAHHAGIGLADRLGLPKIATYHTLFEEYLHHYLPVLPRPWWRFAMRKLSRLQCNRLDALVVPSTAMLDTVRGYGISTPAAVIPTGIDLGGLAGGDGARFRRRLGIAAGRPVLVHVGRVAHEKNIGFLLEVLLEVRRAIPDILLVIAGEGPAQAGLRRRVHEWGLDWQVRFVGYLDRSGELLDCYRAGDAFVFASRTETQGLVLLEAMALGLPVVSTAVMGTRDILGVGRGAVVAREEVADFAGKVVGLLGNPDRRAALAADAVDYARDWSADALAERLLRFYVGVLDRPS